MAKTAKKIPDGYTAVTPYLTVKGAAQAIDFYKKAFGAEEVLRLPMPDGKIAHAEISIGGAIVMLHDEAPDWKAFSPQTVGDTSVSIMLYVNDVDAVFKRAVAAGATSTMEVADQFYGDRAGGVYVWRSLFDAQACYSDAWRKMVTDKYGHEPEVLYVQNPVIVDNVSGTVEHP